MTGNCLSLEQVKFIAANVAPYFGPLLDKPLVEPMTPAEIIAAASRVVATDEALHAAIVAEVFPETSTETDRALIAVRALQVIAATLAEHERWTLIDIVAAELMQHSAVLRGELNHG